MVKNEFFHRLERLLKEIPAKDRKEILSDFEEHFTIGFNEGKTEEEIIQELGDPETIAEEVLTDYYATNPKTPHPVTGITRSILAAIGLLFFNLIVILGPLLGILSAYIAFCSVSVAFVFSPLLSIPIGIDSGFEPFLFAFFSCLVLCGIGVLLGIAMIYVGKFLWYALVSYLRFNINVIMGRNRS